MSLIFSSELRSGEVLFPQCCCATGHRHSQGRKKRILVPQEPLPISRCRVPRGSKFTDSLSVKTLDPPSMLTKVTGFEAEPFHVFENRSNQITKTNDKPLKLIVKWIRPKVIVQVSDQMDEAFLLPARKRIVSSICGFRKF